MKKKYTFFALLLLIAKLTAWGQQQLAAAPPQALPTFLIKPVSPLREVLLEKLKTKDKIKLDLFVMSQCPFGVRAEESLLPIIDELGERIEFKLHFVGWLDQNQRVESMHGQAEVEENHRQVVIAKLYPDLFSGYLLARAKNYQTNEWKSIAQPLGISPEAVEKMMASREGKQLLQEAIRPSIERKIYASPTVFVDDEKYGGRIIPLKTTGSAATDQCDGAPPAIVRTTNAAAVTSTLDAQCDGQPDETNCDDGNNCTLNDACQNGVCTGTPKNCNDNNICTIDGCNQANGQCTYAPLNCNDGNPCTVDVCDAVTGCRNIPLTAEQMNDRNACTRDYCVPNKGVVHEAIICDDNNPNTTDICDPSRGCVSTLYCQVTYSNNIAYVNAAATGSNLGSSWENAFTDLQNALFAAQHCGVTQIWVAKGTYKPTAGTDRNASFSMKNGVAIYGGFAGTETQLSQRNWSTNVTKLSGDLADNDVITGSGPTLSITGNTENNYHVINNVNSLNNTAVLDGFLITGGNAENGNGGGMSNESASPTVSNCVFYGNSALIAGGMINQSNAIPIVTNCTFSCNLSVLNGGGMVNFLSSISSVTVTNCTFSGNRSISGTGGGINNNSESSTTMTNCIFYGNAAEYGGGVSINAYAQSTFTNCTFYGNPGGGIANNNGSSVTVTNCLFWGNGEEIFGQPATVTYSIIQGNYNGTGNRATNPLFVNAAGGDFRLQACSPAIDAGTDTGAPTTDLDGNPRVDAITGGSIADMGAYEYQSTLSNATRWYVNAAVATPGNGTSWACAFQDLQQALAVADSGDEIWVAKGTYKPTSGTDRNVSFVMKNGVAIYGGFAGTESQLSQRNWSTNVTTLSGDLNGDDGSNFTNYNDNSYHVVKGLGDGVYLLDGFVVEKGNSNQVEFDGGAGVYFEGDNLSATLNNCIIRNNLSNYRGAGLDIASYTVPGHPELKIYNSFLLNNSAPRWSALYCFGSGEVVNTVFTGNQASTFSIVISENKTLPFSFTNCTFHDNQAPNTFLLIGKHYIKNCIVTGPLMASGTANIVIKNSIVSSIPAGATDGGGNIITTSAGTYFSNPSNPAGSDGIFGTADDGLLLMPCSPAINAGNDADNNTPTDLAGKNRKVGVIDLGAYEYQDNLPTAITPPVRVSHPTTCTGSDGSITLSGFLNNTTYSVAYKKNNNAVAAANFTSNGNGEITLTDLDAGNYTDIVATYGICVSNAATAALNDPAKPTLHLGTIPDMCAGALAFSIPYTTSTGSPDTYAVSGTGISAVTNGDLSNPITVALTTGASGSSISFTLTVKNTATNCISDNITCNVTVNALPTATISGGGTVCAGATLPNVSIALTGTAPWSITYSNGSTPTTVNNIMTSPYLITQAVAGNYSLTALSDANCTGTAITGSASITVNTLPSLGTTPNSLCTGLALPLSSNSAGSWSSSNPTIASVNNQGLVSALSPGSVNFTFTQTGTGCSATTNNITIKLTPSSNLTASQTDVCPNTEVTLNPNCSIPTASVNWNPGAPTVTPNAATLPYIYKASCAWEGCVGNESSIEVRTHRILVDMKDLDVGTLPLPILRAVKDNMAPTNLIEAPVFPRRWTFIAKGCDASESAMFQLSGPVNFSAIDNAAPYALFANDTNGFYSLDHPNYGNGGSFPNGTYTLNVDLRSQDGVGGPFPKNRVATGSLLAGRNLQFTVVGPPHGSLSARVSIEEEQKIQLPDDNWIRLGQNPINAQIAVQLSGKIGEEIVLSLVNLQGQLIQKKSILLFTSQQHELMETGNAPEGMYFLKAIKGSHIKTFKVLKVE